jgi:hypothetical protein
LTSTLPLKQGNTFFTSKKICNECYGIGLNYAMSSVVDRCCDCDAMLDKINYGMELVDPITVVKVNHYK